MTFENMMQELKAQHSDALSQMALPPGVEEFLQARIREGDTETITFMLKLAWVFGAQAGHQALIQAAQTEQAPQRKRVEA
jgi:hypothetical protein